MKKIEEYRVRGDVDNQLGLLYELLKVGKVEIPRPETTPLTFEGHPEMPSVLITKDVIPEDLAKKALDFIKEVPFDATIPMLNDNNNMPRDMCICYPPNRVPNEYKCRYSSPKEFIWEHYLPNMYRLTPLTLRAFYGSPLIEVFNILTWRWYLNEDIDVKNMIHTTWVIQKIDMGGDLLPHDDAWSNRRVSFVYYLTDEDWTSSDGGLLGVASELLSDIDTGDVKSTSTEDIKEKMKIVEKIIEILPKFNTMISWEMKEGVSPIHWVTRVNSKKARYALVGFWATKDVSPS